MNKVITCCHRIGNIECYLFLSFRIGIGYGHITLVLSLSRCTSQRADDRRLIIRFAYLTVEPSILRSSVFGSKVTLCCTAIVTCAEITIYANSIDTRSKTSDLLIGIVVLAIVLSTIRNRTTTSKCSTAPTSGAVAIIEVRVLNLSCHVSRILHRGIALSPLYISSGQILKSLLKLCNSSICICEYSIISGSLCIALALNIIQSFLQLLTGINNKFNSIRSSLQLVRCAGSIVIHSQLLSNISA